MALLAGGAARRESVTIDEVAHVGAGVSYLQKLDLRLNEEHPPLAKVMAALPLVLRGAHADYSHLSWTFSNKIFNQYLAEWVFGDWFLMRWNDPYSTMRWARAPMLLVTLLLGLVLYIYGSRLSGAWGGLLCLSAFVTMPAFLAFGPLVLTDIAVTLFWVLTVWQLPNMWRSPTRGTVVRFALALAGALLSKFSSGLLFFVFIAYALSLRCNPLPEQPVEKDRTPPLASTSVAQSCKRHALGRVICLRGLFCALLEPANGFIWTHPSFSGFADSAPAAHARMALLARAGAVCAECRESAHFHPRPCLSSRSLVLFSRALPLEIAVGVPFAAPSCRRDGLARKAPFTSAISNTCRHGSALAQPSGFLW